jgi:hypothetical protein
MAASLGELVAAHERFANVFRTKPVPSLARDPLGAVEEVKHLYLAHKHRECSSRAVQLVGDLTDADVSHYTRFSANGKVIWLDPTILERGCCQVSKADSYIRQQVHPLHIAALYFYAGLSFDTAARNMPYKSHLLFGNLEQALVFYCRAIESLEAELKTPETQTPKPLTAIRAPRMIEDISAFDLTVKDSSRNSIGFANKNLMWPPKSTDSPSPSSNSPRSISNVSLDRLMISTPRRLPLRTNKSYLSRLPSASSVYSQESFLQERNSSAMNLMTPRKADYANSYKSPPRNYSQNYLTNIPSPASSSVYSQASLIPDSRSSSTATLTASRSNQGNNATNPAKTSPSSLRTKIASPEYKIATAPRQHGRLAYLAQPNISTINSNFTYSRTSTASSLSSFEGYPPSALRGVEKPPPLQIRRASTARRSVSSPGPSSPEKIRGAGTSRGNSPFEAFDGIALVPASSRAGDLGSLYSFRPDSSASAAAAAARDSQARAIRKFNASLDGFVAMIHDHIDSVERFRARVAHKQAVEVDLSSAVGRENEYGASRKSGDSGRYGSGRRDRSETSMSWEEMTARIQRLREKDFAMPELDVERTSSLRERALEDLAR